MNHLLMMLEVFSNISLSHMEVNSCFYSINYKLNKGRVCRYPYPVHIL